MARIPSALLALSLCWAIFPSHALEIDFEDLGSNLPIDGNFFYDGRSAVDPGDPDATDFVSQGTTFNNEFTEFFPGCCWQGWSYSQTTDVVTAGPANQYSSVTGGGVNGSATYGVGFTGGAVGATDIVSIELGAVFDVQGAYFTNTAWAALSITNGDGFAKVFGGVSGDDEDFLKLTISGFDALGASTGAVDFFLADYRFADNNEDYIVAGWTWVDLTALGSVKSLDMTIESTDTGFGFINTPAYFAMDDLLLIPEPSTGALLAVGLLGLGARGTTRRRRGCRSCPRPWLARS